MAINYQEELKRMKEYVPADSDYWSPEAGQHRVKAVGELEEAPPFDDDEEKKPRAKLQIEVGGKKQVWGMSVGKTEASTYGQLCKVAGINNNILKDKEFTVVVTGQDRNKRFTIVI